MTRTRISRRFAVPAEAIDVELAAGRRRPIPPELLESFDPVPEESEVRRTLGLAT